MNTITKEQLSKAEDVIFQKIKDPYDQQEAWSQLHSQIKAKKHGKLWANFGEFPVMFCIKGQLDISLSQEVSKILGLL